MTELRNLPSMRRKRIDNFLVKLEEYITWKPQAEIVDLYMPFKLYEWDIMTSLWTNKRKIETPIMMEYINWFIKNRWTAKYKRRAVIWNALKENFLRRVAYSMNWVEVNEVNYEHIIEKHMFLLWNSEGKKLEYTVLDWISKFPNEKFLIPDWFLTDDNLYFFEK